MSEFDNLRGLGYEFSYLKKAGMIPPHTAPVLVLIHKGDPLPSPENLGGEFGIVTTLAEDVASFIQDRTKEGLLSFAPVVLPVDEGSDFLCNIDYRQDGQNMNIATLRTRERGREMVITLGLSGAQFYPEISGYPPLEQMQGLLEDYSRVFRVRKTGKSQK